MKQSLIITTNDLLNYHKYGNYNKFDRCFSKACRYLDLDFSTQKLSHLRRFTFHYLRSSGLIDVSFKGSVSLWSTSPNSLIELNGLGFVPIGTSLFQKTILNIFSGSKVDIINEPAEKEGLKNGVMLYPNLNLLIEESNVVIEACAKLGVPLVLDFQKTMFQYLPNIDRALKQCLTVIKDDLVFNPESAFKLNYETNKWDNYPSTRPDGQGAFMVERKYSAPDYFIVTEGRRKNLEYFEVHEKEWYAITAASKLGKPIPIKYSVNRQSLQLPKSTAAFKIPNLLERCLRSGRIHNPLYENQQRTYLGITYASVLELIAKYPLFKLELI